MKYSIVLILLLSLFTMCENLPTPVSNPWLEKKLKDKYGDNFVIIEDDYNFEIACHQFTAYPGKFPNLRTYGRHNNKDWESDDYTEQYYAYQLEQQTKEIIEKTYKKNIAVMAWTHLSFEPARPLGDISYWLKYNNEKDKGIRIYIYMFEQPNEHNKITLLLPLLNVINYYQQFHGLNIRFGIYYWDNNFLDGKDFKKLKFTLNADDGTNADSSASQERYVKKVLDISYNTSQKISFNTDVLYEMIRPFKISRTTFNFNPIGIDWDTIPPIIQRDSAWAEEWHRRAKMDRDSVKILLHDPLPPLINKIEIDPGIENSYTTEEHKIIQTPQLEGPSAEEIALSSVTTEENKWTVFYENVSTLFQPILIHTQTLCQLYNRKSLKEFIAKPYTDLSGGIFISSTVRLKGFYDWQFREDILQSLQKMATIEIPERTEVAYEEGNDTITKINAVLLLIKGKSAMIKEQAENIITFFDREDFDKVYTYTVDLVKEIEELNQLYQKEWKYCL